MIVGTKVGASAAVGTDVGFGMTVGTKVGVGTAVGTDVSLGMVVGTKLVSAGGVRMLAWVW